MIRATPAPCSLCDEFAMLNAHGLCPHCETMVHAEAAIGYFELCTYLVKVSAYQRWCSEHGVAA